MTEKQRVDPTLTDVLRNVLTDFRRSLNCVKVGEVKKFNGTTKTAEVQVLFRRRLKDGQIASFPLLVDVPVFTLQGGGGAIQFPVAAGDQCLVLFADRSLDTWFQTGSEALPPDSRAHDISDAIALVGLNSLASDLAAYPAAEVRISFGGAMVSLKNGLISIKNDTTDLLTVLEGLIDTIKALQVEGPISLTAASQAALEAQKLVLEGLLDS